MLYINIGPVEGVAVDGPCPNTNMINLTFGFDLTLPMWPSGHGEGVNLRMDSSRLPPLPSPSDARFGLGGVGANSPPRPGSPDGRAGKTAMVTIERCDTGIVNEKGEAKHQRSIPCRLPQRH